MSKLAKVCIGTGFTLFVILLAGGIFLRRLLVKSYPVADGTLHLSGIRGAVDIYRDGFGVPHVSARNEHDLMYGAGYLHAQDRLWQMDLWRRTGQGRLSELFDSATVDFDRLFRTLGFAGLADSLEKHLHPDSRRLLEDYAEGVNEFIDTHSGKYPVEFDILNYKPERWTVPHSLLISRLISWQRSRACWLDLVYAEIAEKVPPEKFGEICLPSGDKSFTGPNGGTGGTDAFLDLVRRYRSCFHIGPFSSGGNAWVIGPGKSMSGHPILANDPHLFVSLPAVWYEVHLSAPGWNVAGFTVPGIPLIAIGHNDSIVWGFTDAPTDDADLYIETDDTLKPGHYLYKNISLPVQNREETIQIGRAGSLAVQVRSTRHGPVINGFGRFDENKESVSPHGHRPVSLRWTGFEMCDEILGFYMINKATNAAEFDSGIKHLTVPAQCVVYADVRGNIGSWTTGLIPVRGKKTGAVLLDGSSGENEWEGFIKPGNLPKSWNPAEEIIVSADCLPADNPCLYSPSYATEHRSRCRRITDLLDLDKISAADVQQFQQDVVSYYSRDLAETVLQVLGEDSTLETDVHNALIYVRNWNYRLSPTDIASTIVGQFFIKLIHNIYADELGGELMADFLYVQSEPYILTHRLLQREYSLWYDNVDTDSVETKGDIIRKSFIQAVVELKASLGGEMKTWQWGKIHRIVFEHPLGRRKPFDKVFDVGPFQIGGGGESINKGAFDLANPFRLFALSSMRQIVDIGNPLHAYTIVTLGQTGQPLHEHYDDQVSLWLNGGYKKVTIDWNEIKNQKWDHLELKPANG